MYSISSLLALKTHKYYECSKSIKDFETAYKILIVFFKDIIYWDHAFSTKSQHSLLKKIKPAFNYFKTVANLFFINFDDFVVILSKFGGRQSNKTTKCANQE